MKTLFILEDNDDLRELYTYIFDPLAYDLKMFASVAAFEAADLSNADLFLLDIMLPDGDGMQVCQKLKDNLLTSQIPVILISAHQHADIVGEKCPWASFLHKPFDIATLEVAVSDAVGQNVHKS